MTRVYHQDHYEDDDAKRQGVFGVNAPVLGSFLNVVEAKRVSKSTKEEPKFSSNFEFEDGSPALKALRGKIVAVAAAHWPGKNIGEEIREGRLLVPITSGDSLAEKAIAKGKKREWSRGKQVLTARSQYQPEISVVSKGEAVILNEDPLLKTKAKDIFYTGVGVLFEVNLVAYDPVGSDGKPGVTAYLNIVCSTGKGEKLISAGERSSEAFKGYIGLETTEDLTGAAGAAADTAW